MAATKTADRQTEAPRLKERYVTEIRTQLQSELGSAT